MQFIESAGSRGLPAASTKRKLQDDAIAKTDEAKLRAIAKRYREDMLPLKQTSESDVMMTAEIADKRFKQINTEQLLNNLQTYDTDKTIGIATQIINNSALSGGLIVDIPKLKLSAAHKAWLVEMLTALARPALRMKDALGFVAFSVAPMPEPRRGKAVLLNPDHCLFLHHRGLFSVDDWVAVEKPTVNEGDFFLNPRLEFKSRVLPGVYFITDTGPDRSGNIVSRVSKFKSELVLQQITDICTLRADIRRSNPDIFIEAELEKIDPERSRPSQHQMFAQALATHSQGLMRDGEIAAIGEVGGTSSERKIWTDSFMQYHGERQFHTARTHPSLEPTANSATVREEALLMYDVHHGPVHGYKLELPPGHKVAKAQLPEPPKERADTALRTQQIGLMIWGVPPAMIQAESSQGRVTAVDHNMLTTWYATMRETKRFLTDFYKKVLTVMYQPDLIQRAMATIPLTKTVTKQDIEDALEINIDIPGAPPMEELRILYQEGVLKFDAYKQILAAAYSMPEDAFESEPQIGIDDLLTQGKANLIPPPQTAVGGSGAKRKPASKSKR